MVKNPLRSKTRGDESTEVAKISGEKSTGETNVEDKTGSEKSIETINKVGGEFSRIQV